MRTCEIFTACMAKIQKTLETYCTCTNAKWHPHEYPSHTHTHTDGESEITTFRGRPNFIRVLSTSAWRRPFAQKSPLINHKWFGNIYTKPDIRRAKITTTIAVWHGQGVNISFRSPVPLISRYTMPVENGYYWLHRTMTPERGQREQADDLNRRNRTGEKYPPKSSNSKLTKKQQTKRSDCVCVFSFTPDPQWMRTFKSLNTCSGAQPLL